MINNYLRFINSITFITPDATSVTTTNQEDTGLLISFHLTVIVDIPTSVISIAGAEREP